MSDYNVDDNNDIREVSPLSGMIACSLILLILFCGLFGGFLMGIAFTGN